MVTDLELLQLSDLKFIAYRMLLSVNPQDVVCDADIL